MKEQGRNKRKDRKLYPSPTLDTEKQKARQEINLSRPQEKKMRHRIPREVKAAARQGLKLRKAKQTGNEKNRAGYIIATRLATFNNVNTATLRKIAAYHARWGGAVETETVKINNLLWGGKAAITWAEKELS